MHNSQGVPTNGIQGFVRHIFFRQYIKYALHCHYMLGYGTINFRNDMFDGYKQNRSAPPRRSIAHNLIMLKKFQSNIGFVNIGVKNYEANVMVHSTTIFN
ncbi:hypothetical protein ACVPOS_11970 [Staphylococcus aureus]